MATVDPRTRLTAADLLAMPDGERFELVDGELVDTTVGAESSFVAVNLLTRLNEFARQSVGGFVFGPDCGYRCFQDDPETVRKPDVSWVANGRLPHNRPPAGFIESAPDLAAEIVSPHDSALDVEQKVEDFLSAGVQLLWIVYPQTRSVLVYRADGSTTRLRENDELLGETVLPGFRCRVVELLPG